MIKIGGSDLVDAVYLDEEGEGRLRGTSLRSTEASVREGRIPILIGGDEVEGESGGIPIATRARRRWTLACGRGELPFAGPWAVVDCNG